MCIYIWLPRKADRLCAGFVQANKVCNCCPSLKCTNNQYKFWLIWKIGKLKHHSLVYLFYIYHIYLRENRTRSDRAYRIRCTCDHDNRTTRSFWHKDLKKKKWEKNNRIIMYVFPFWQITIYLLTIFPLGLFRSKILKHLFPASQLHDIFQHFL